MSYPGGLIGLPLTAIFGPAQAGTSALGAGFNIAQLIQQSGVRSLGSGLIDPDNSGLEASLNCFVGTAGIPGTIVFPTSVIDTTLAAGQLLTQGVVDATANIVPTGVISPNIGARNGGPIGLFGQATTNLVAGNLFYKITKASNILLNFGTTAPAANATAGAPIYMAGGNTQYFSLTAPATGVIKPLGVANPTTTTPVSAPFNFIEMSINTNGTVVTYYMLPCQLFNMH